MAEFKEYTRYAASYCPNLPYIVFNRAFLSASREYFTKTQAWQEVVSLNLVVGQSEYEIPDPFECALTDTIHEVLLDGEPLSPVEHEVINAGTGKPLYFATPTKQSIHVYPTPKETGTLSIKLNLKPSIYTDFIPDEVFDEHFEALIAGCIWQIKRMPKTDWHDPQSANDFAFEFNKFIDEKRIQLMRGNNNTELTISYPSFT